jgi:hypothetical protein
MAESLREQRGRTVRETWVTWARRQRNPKPSWLTGWDDLDADQREVDMLIGEAVAEGERKRCVAEIFAYADEYLAPFVGAVYRDAARLLNRGQS